MCYILKIHVLICVMKFTFANTCMQGMVYHNHTKTCMVLVNQVMPYQTATRYCKQTYPDGRLVHILDEETDTFIKGHVLNDGWGTIGLHKSHSSDSYRWGEEQNIASYFRWKENQENVASNSLYVATGGKGWGKSNGYGYFICQSRPGIAIFYLNGENFSNNIVKTTEVRMNELTCKAYGFNTNYDLEIVHVDGVNNVTKKASQTEYNTVSIQLNGSCNSSGSYVCKIMKNSKIISELQGVLRVKCTARHCSELDPSYEVSPALEYFVITLCIIGYPVPNFNHLYTDVLKKEINSTSYKFQLINTKDNSNRLHLTLTFQANEFDFGRYYVSLDQNGTKFQLYFNVRAKYVFSLNDKNLINKTLELAMNETFIITCQVKDRGNFSIKILFDDGNNQSIIVMETTIEKSLLLEIPPYCNSSGVYICNIGNKNNSIIVLRGTIKKRCAVELCYTNPNVFKVSSPSDNMQFNICLWVYPQPKVFLLFRANSQQKIDSSTYSATFKYLNNISVQGNLEIIIFPETNFKYGTFMIEVRESDQMSRIYFNISGPPQCPTNLTAAIIYDHTVRLTWTPGSDGGSRQTFLIATRTTNQGFRTLNVSDSGDDVIMCDVSHLTSASNYTFSMGVINDQGETTCDHLLTNVSLLEYLKLSEDNVQTYVSAVSAPLLMVLVLCFFIVFKLKLHQVIISEIHKKRRPDKRISKLEKTVDTIKETDNSLIYFNISRSCRDAPLHSITKNEQASSNGRVVNPDGLVYITVSINESTHLPECSKDLRKCKETRSGHSSVNYTTIDFPATLRAAKESEIKIGL